MSVKTSDSLSHLKSLREAEIINDQQAVEFNCRIDPAVASKLIKEKIFATRKRKNTKELGDDLEEVANYFLDNCGFISNLRGDFKNQSHQLDHWGKFSHHVQDMLKSHGIQNLKLLGESKNYSKKEKINVDVIYKVESIKYLLKIGVGCYFTREGLTGKDEIKAAKAVLKHWCTTTDTISICFHDKDWKFLEKNPKMFQRLFWSKIDSFSAIHHCEISDYSKIKDYGL